MYACSPETEYVMVVLSWSLNTTCLPGRSACRAVLMRSEKNASSSSMAMHLLSARSDSVVSTSSDKWSDRCLCVTPCRL